MDHWEKKNEGCYRPPGRCADWKLTEIVCAAQALAGPGWTLTLKSLSFPFYEK